MPARALPPRQDDALAELADLVVAMQPDELERFTAQLDPDDRRIIEQVMGERYAVGWRANPAAMANHFDQRFRVWRYIDLLSRKFVEAIDGTSPRQIWNLPGRYGKTSVLEWGVTWALDRDPAARNIWVTYGDQLALESAFRIRDLLRTHKAELRAELRRDRQQLDRFATGEGGGLLAGGIATGITGFGVSKGGVLVVDDPFKNWQEAHSQAKRLLVHSMFKGTLRNRLDDEEAGMIVCHHRVHQDDLTGRLVEEAAQGGEQWEVVSLPALSFGDGDRLGRAAGEVIEPERFSAEAVRSRHVGMGSYLVAALEQQQPQPPEGNELLREWFVIADTLPERPSVAITSWDLKLKDREVGDYVVGQVWWKVAGAYWLMDQLRGQFDHATTANAIALLAVRHPEVRSHAIEAAASADDVLPQLRKPIDGYEVTDEMAVRLGMSPAERDAVTQLRRRGMAQLVKHAVRGDKSLRARNFIAPAAEAGLVRINPELPGLAALLDELAGFPEGHDDQVDAMSQALQRLDAGVATIAAPSGSITQAGPGGARAGGGSLVSVPRGVLPSRR